MEISKIKLEKPLAVKEPKGEVVVQIVQPVNKLSDKLEDYDNNEFLLDIYAEDIHKFLKSLESKHFIRERYLTSSHIMTHTMRSLLVDWLFEVQQTFKLLNETIHLSISLLDLFMQDHPSIPKDKLQLVGVSCIFLASKYEEMYPPGKPLPHSPPSPIDIFKQTFMMMMMMMMAVCLFPDVLDFVDISASTYTKQEIFHMEQVIFSSLNFQMGRPSPAQFLRRYSRVGNVDIITYSLAKYFIDLSLVSYNLCHVSPSLIAASALYLSLR